MCLYHKAGTRHMNKTFGFTLLIYWKITQRIPLPKWKGEVLKETIDKEWLLKVTKFNKSRLKIEKTCVTDKASSLIVRDCVRSADILWNIEYNVVSLLLGTLTLNWHRFILFPQVRKYLLTKIPSRRWR